MEIRRILFLDVDGVLLPIQNGRYWRYHEVHAAGPFLPITLLTAFLEQYPTLDLVLSSNWRLVLGIDRVRSLFPEHLRHRLVSQTPLIGTGEDRAAECMAWVNTHAPTSLFAAVDDLPELFAGNVRWLVATDPSVGIDEKALLRIRDLLILKSK